MSQRNRSLVNLDIILVYIIDYASSKQNVKTIAVLFNCICLQSRHAFCHNYFRVITKDYELKYFLFKIK